MYFNFPFNIIIILSSLSFTNLARYNLTLLNTTLINTYFLDFWDSSRIRELILELEILSVLSLLTARSFKSPNSSSMKESSDNYAIFDWDIDFFLTALFFFEISDEFLRLTFTSFGGNSICILWVSGVLVFT